MAFHIVKMENKPQKSPLPVGLRWPPFNTAVPRPTASTTSNRSSNGWGTVAHVRRKVPIGYNGAPQMCPQKYPFPWTDPQTPLPASSLDPPDLRCQTAFGSDPPFCHNALNRPTERARESLTTIARSAQRARRPKKYWSKYWQYTGEKTYCNQVRAYSNPKIIANTDPILEKSIANSIAIGLQFVLQY